MIGWTRLVGAAAWVMSASLACAAATPKPSTPNSSPPDYVRSPPLDYSDGPRSAGDGEVMGAHQRFTADWLAGSASTDHPAPGWSLVYGEPRFTLEGVRDSQGSGGGGQALACPPAQKPLTPDDARAYVAQRRAWLESVRTPQLPRLASAIADMPRD